jgi:hypothetical protein
MFPRRLDGMTLRKQTNKQTTYHAQTQGASNALLIAADQDRPAIVKVILQYWTGEDEMVICLYLCHVRVCGHVWRCAILELFSLFRVYLFSLKF